MPLLLDTCAAIWMAAGAAMDSEAEDAIDRARDMSESVYVSAVTAWEVGLLASKGRFAAPLSPKAWFDRLMAIDSFALVNVTPALFIESCFLPGKLSRDPGDRIIVATAREHGLTIVTRDRKILDYSNAGHVLALAC